MIDIKDIQGNIIYSVPITQSCQKVEELMGADYIQLSWNSDTGDEIPLGAYIEYDGEVYRLLEPYKPTPKDEMEYVYTPQFQSRVMIWKQTPFFFYSGESKEPDWSFTSNPANFMSQVCKGIGNETGESWAYSIDSSLPASASLSFTSVDIYSALGQIASAFDTEWFADKGSNTICLGQSSHGSTATLEVGSNVSAPTIQKNKDGYYTRFYAFGSTRNITQDYEGASTNNLVNKRLTLDPSKYPNGYKDIGGGVTLSKVLIFDDIYPSANLSISGVRNRLMYRLDNDGSKIKVGTDEEGNPIYDQYAIWYFRIEGFDFDVSNIIEGYNLSVSFTSGALQGRDFELKYYESDTTINTSDGVVFEAKAGDYEILFVEENTYIIPSLVGLVPSDGDNVILFNIKMPSEYTQSAYTALESAMNKEISRMTSDLNNYTLKSNPVAFNEDNPNLSVGRSVRYVNGDYAYSTRVIRLVTQLDYPIEQEITIGNLKVKGNTQQIKEEVVNANNDINLLSVLNDMTQSIQQSYARAQRMMLEGFASIKNIWQFKEDASGQKYIWSAYHVVTQQGVTSYADSVTFDLPSIYAGLPIDNSTLYWEETTAEDGTVSKVLKAAGGSGSGDGTISSINVIGSGNAVTGVSLSEDKKSLEFTKDMIFAEKTYLDNNFFTKTYVNENFITKENANELYVTIATGQTITGEKNFTGGLKVNGCPLVYNATYGYWKLEGDLLVTGGIAAYSSDTEFSPTTIMDGIVTDGTTIHVNDSGQLEVIGGSGSGGSVDESAVKEIIESYNYLTEAKLPIATTSVKGIASFDSDYFSVTSGVVKYTGATVRVVSSKPSSPIANSLYVIVE